RGGDRSIPLRNCPAAAGTVRLHEDGSLPRPNRKVGRGGSRLRDAAAPRSAVGSRVRRIGGGGDARRSARAGPALLQRNDSARPAQRRRPAVAGAARRNDRFQSGGSTAALRGNKTACS